MPKKVDHAQRRRELAEALWRVTRRDGWDAVSLRHVAAEAGVSMGMVQHYFSTKDEMLRFAFEIIGEDYQERVTRRIVALSEPREPRRVVEIVLEELLPTDDRGRVEVQAAAAFLGRAVFRPELAASVAASGALLTRYVAAHLPTADAERDAAGLLAFVDGLIAHTLTGRISLPDARAILDTQLDRIFEPSTTD